MGNHTALESHAGTLKAFSTAGQGWNSTSLTDPCLPVTADQQPSVQQVLVPPRTPVQICTNLLPTNPVLQPRAAGVKPAKGQAQHQALTYASLERHGT